MKYFLFYIGLFITAIGQVFLKISAEKSKKNNKSWIYFLLIGYFFMFLVTLLNLYLFKWLPAKIMITAPVAIYFFINILSKFVFKDKSFENNLLENILILIGIIVFCVGG